MLIKIVNTRGTAHGLTSTASNKTICHKIPDAAINEGISNVIRESASFELIPVRLDMYNLAILSARPDLDELLEVIQLA
jgi:hypothetical protein